MNASRQRIAESHLKARGDDGVRPHNEQRERNGPGKRDADHPTHVIPDVVRDDVGPAVEAVVQGEEQEKEVEGLPEHRVDGVAEAQQRHYNGGVPQDWQGQFVSAYASMHPWEDWAETFAHYLHIVDTLETAGAYGLALTPGAASGVPMPDVKTRRLHFDDFDELIAAWFPLTNALNSLNRSMGLADLYPFVLSEPAIAKLRFVHEAIAETSRRQSPETS